MDEITYPCLKFNAGFTNLDLKSKRGRKWRHFDGLAQDYSNPIAIALELLQSCAKPSICMGWKQLLFCALHSFYVCLNMVKSGKHDLAVFCFVGLYLMYLPIFIRAISVALGNRKITQWPIWRHQMETFSTILALCEGNSPVPGRFPSQRPVTRCFDVFFNSRLNKGLSKQPRRRWFETPSRPLWRHCDDSEITRKDVVNIS